MAIWMSRANEAHGYYLLSTIPSWCKVTKFLSGLHVTQWVSLGWSGSMCSTRCVLIISRKFVQALTTSGQYSTGHDQQSDREYANVSSCTGQRLVTQGADWLEEINLLCARWSRKMSVISTYEKWDNKQTCCIPVFLMHICICCLTCVSIGINSSRLLQSNPGLEFKSTTEGGIPHASQFLLQT